MPTLDDMGLLNAGWGVCGFTSSFYAIYNLNQWKGGTIINANKAFRVLAEIKTYLVTLQADGKTALLGEIETFTKTFPGFEGFKVDDYIRSINAAVSKTESEIIGDSKFSIAMPPEGVADYLNRMWGCKVSVDIISGGDGRGNGIIGVSEGASSSYDGLKHYKYRRNGVIYSWGQQFSTVVQAMGGPNWRVCRFIKVPDQ
jgi:hypothetical protein